MFLSILSPEPPAKFAAPVVYRALLVAPKRRHRPGRLPSNLYAASLPAHSSPFDAACPFALPARLHHRRHLSRLAGVPAPRWWLS